jgi:hypothetical protein
MSRRSAYPTLGADRKLLRWSGNPTGPKSVRLFVASDRNPTECLPLGNKKGQFYNSWDRTNPCVLWVSLVPKSQSKPEVPPRVPSAHVIDDQSIPNQLPFVTSKSSLGVFCALCRSLCLFDWSIDPPRPLSSHAHANKHTQTNNIKQAVLQEADTDAATEDAEVAALLAEVKEEEALDLF